MTASGGRSVGMKQRPRIYYTEAQKALMWDRWKAGDTLHEIGKLFDRPHTSIHTILSATGGIRPPARRRSRLALTMAEREEISRALAAGESIRCVAKRLKRAASTISRELLRNGGKTCYRATKADEAAWERAHRPKTCKLACNPALAQIVAGKLQSQWSPEQIAGWLERTYPDDTGLQVSHRSHLSHALRPNTWSLEERASGAFAAHQGNASLTPLHPEDADPWPNRRCSAH